MQSRGTGGVSFVGLLTAVFIGLKLAGKITWPWVWVLSPVWIVAAMIGLLVILAAIL